MLNLTTPVTFDPHGQRWVIDGTHLDYGTALWRLRSTGHEDAEDLLQRARARATLAGPADSAPVAAGDEVTVTIVGTVTRVLDDGRLELSHTGPAPSIGRYITVDPEALSTSVARRGVAS